MIFCVCVLSAVDHQFANYVLSATTLVLSSLSDELIYYPSGNFCRGCGASLFSQQLARSNIQKCPHCSQDVTEKDEKTIYGGKEYHRKCYDIIKGEQQVKGALLLFQGPFMILISFSKQYFIRRDLPALLAEDHHRADHRCWQGLASQVLGVDPELRNQE